jgi:hypothetical protein
MWQADSLPSDPAGVASAQREHQFQGGKTDLEPKKGKGASQGLK